MSTNESLEVRPGSLMEIIDKLASSPGALDKIEVMERLLAMQERVMAEQRKQAFMAAEARLHAAMPPMDKLGKAKNSKFAKLEDIDVVIRPLLAEEGFSFSFDEESHTDKTATFIAKLSHRDGHSEVKRLTVPIDVASKNAQGVSIRPAIQDYGSMVSYARRYLIKMHLNIIEKDEDTNGEKNEKIGKDEARDLSTAINDHGLELPRFLVFMKVGSIEEILAADSKKAWNAVEAKKLDNEMKNKTTKPKDGI